MDDLKKILGVTNAEIVREEVEGILSDIREAYDRSGKRYTSNFEKQLHARYEGQKGEVWGVKYLAGRPPGGKLPPVKEIEKWVKYRGLASGSKQRSLAWAIAKSIQAKGTVNTFNIYESVITPERINRIIQRISSLNVNRIVTYARAQLEIFERNI